MDFRSLPEPTTAAIQAPGTLRDLQDRETACHRKEIGYKVVLPDGPDDQLSDREVERALDQEESNNATPLCKMLFLLMMNQPGVEMKEYPDLKANVHQDVSEGYGGNSLASVSDREKRVSTVFRGNLLHYQYIPVL
ncbi:hypothetical protein BKA61DRAFT_673061 [Leptodontidium sp. MPI-SDFR-AT-0119]|nr:hypothetical protein BKA61DRAFT_673061 [Leptodontidium sp. MPI-SDFR-AT-0119]